MARECKITSLSKYPFSWHRNCFAIAVGIQAPLRCRINVRFVAPRVSGDQSFFFFLDDLLEESLLDDESELEEDSDLLDLVSDFGSDFESDFFDLSASADFLYESLR